MTTLGSILSTQEMESRAVNTESDGSTVTVALSTDALVRKWTTTQNHTVNISGTQKAGQLLILLITNDATLPRVTTLGTGFVGVGTITGVISKTSAVMFISNGTSFFELCRTVGI